MGLWRENRPLLLVGTDNLKILRQMATNESAEQRQRWNRVERLRAKYEKRKGLFPVTFTGSLDDLLVVISAEDRTNSFLNRPGYRPSLYNELAVRKRIGKDSSWRNRNLDTFSASELDAWVRIFQEYWLDMIETLTEIERPTLETNNATMSDTAMDGTARKRARLVDDRSEANGFNNNGGIGSGRFDDDASDDSTGSSDSGASSPPPLTPDAFRQHSLAQNRVYLPLRFEVCATVFENDTLSAAYAMTASTISSFPSTQTRDQFGALGGKARIDVAPTTHAENEVANRVRQRVSFENRYLSHRILERNPPPIDENGLDGPPEEQPAPIPSSWERSR